MKRMMKGVLGLLCLLLIFPLSAAEIARVTVPDKISLEGGHRLVLNGAGIRYKFIFKIYVGALYLPEKMPTAEEIIASTGPKRILMRFLYDKVDKRDLEQAWREGFAANHDEPAMRQLEERLSRFSALFSDALKGDEFWLDNIPDFGTRVSVNGEPKGTIPGDDFYPALLRIWIGSEPVTTELKRAMLGQE
ncbi:chalcone isomerase family protein [Sedimenticola hydrogenitrophicus]|uniref:chalcone isomerase family protein n=1 Tax=Sedimenticola hydrogenitrophicus TaxID=2967975 RepID=UPI0021A5D97D|nr:chalcone isomerase family protein [Sedimenticola hydrogenitrophicus]